MKNIEFKKLKNARDIGGINTLDGKTVRKGIIYRSGHMSRITKSDALKLKNDLDIRMIIDLRSSSEKEKRPNVPVDGIRYLEIPYFNEDTLAVTGGMGSDVRSALKNAENQQELYEYVPDLNNVYKLFAADEFSVSQIGECLKTIMANRDGAVLFHCSAGKDRTGITAALIYHILGVGPDDIMADYLFTNTVSEKPSIKYSRLIRIFMRNKPLAEKVRKVFLADELYLNTFFEEISVKYGGTDKFISDVLKITDEQIESFKDYALE